MEVPYIMEGSLLWLKVYSSIKGVGFSEFLGSGVEGLIVSSCLLFGA